jgi:hypothetical protein
MKQKSTFNYAFYIVAFLVSYLAAGPVAHAQANEGNSSLLNADPGKTLDILYTTFDDFKKLKKGRLILAYTLSGGKLTLHGWSFHHSTFGDNYHGSPDLKLEIYKPGSSNYPLNFYFPNFVLRHVKRLKREFRKADYKYVYFVPYVEDGLLHFRVVGHKTKTADPGELEKQPLIANDANPSPPKHR